MPKRFLRLLGAGSALVLTGAGLSGCTIGEPSTASPDGRPTVLTTFTVLADIAQNVAGPYLRVQSLTRAGAEIHGYEPTPDDVRRAAGADLILDNGLHLEAWFERFVEDLDVLHVVVSQDVDPIDIRPEDGDDDTDELLPNPHAWMSPLNAQLYVATIAEAFVELDPAHAEEYTANAAAYTAQLQAIATDMSAELATVAPERRALVSCEGAFSYLARDADLQEAYIWAVNAEQQSTPQKVAATIEFVRDNDVPAVFCESTVSADPMRQVAQEAGSRFAGTLYVDSLSGPDGPVPTYLDLLRHDVDTIVAGLTAQP